MLFFVCILHIIEWKHKIITEWFEFYIVWLRLTSGWFQAEVEEENQGGSEIEEAESTVADIEKLFETTQD